MTYVERLEEALRLAREDATFLALELDRHGHGDLHYGDLPREKGVVTALAAHKTYKLMIEEILP